MIYLSKIIYVVQVRAIYQSYFNNVGTLFINLFQGGKISFTLCYVEFNVVSNMRKINSAIIFKYIYNIVNNKLE